MLLAESRLSSWIWISHLLLLWMIMEENRVDLQHTKIKVDGTHHIVSSCQGRKWLNSTKFLNDQRIWDRYSSALKSYSLADISCSPNDNSTAFSTAGFHLLFFKRVYLLPRPFLGSDLHLWTLSSLALFIHVFFRKCNLSFLQYGKHNI